MSEVGDTNGDTGEQTSPTVGDTALPRKAEPRKRSLARMLLWSSVDLDSRGLSADAMGIAAGIAFASSMAVLYLLGESWGAYRFVQVFTIVAGLAVGVAGTYDVLTRRPSQLLVPLAQVFAVVLLLAISLRLAGYQAASRSALAWSLGLHLCLLPLTSRLWAIFFGERANGRDVVHRSELLADAKAERSESLLVRVLDTDPGFSEVKPIGPVGTGVIRMSTNLFTPRPRPGLVYVLSKPVIINRSVPGSEVHGHWARYIIGVQESVLLGERAKVTEPAEAAALSLRALLVLVAISVTLTGLAAAAAL